MGASDVPADRPPGTSPPPPVHTLYTLTLLITHDLVHTSTLHAAHHSSYTFALISSSLSVRVLCFMLAYAFRFSRQAMCDAGTCLSSQECAFLLC